MIKRILFSLFLFLFCNTVYGSGAIVTPTDQSLITSDITTNDVSTSKHGFVPKAPSDSTKFLNGANPPVWAVPAGGGGSNTPVFDYTVAGSAVQTITTNGTVTLDGNTHGGFIFEFDLYNTTAGDVTYRMYVENDTTNTNYNWVQIGSAAGNEPKLHTTTPTASVTTIKGTITITSTGIVMASNLGFIRYNTGAMGICGTNHYTKIATVANITRIDIIASVASGIGIGSTVRLWNRK